MSGPRGQDPNQSWQPGQPADHSQDQTTAGSPWQQQPTQDGTWQAPAYTPQYQQPSEPAYPQQYPSTPGYGSDLGSQETQFGQVPQFGQSGQYGQYGQQSDQYGPATQYAQPAQYGQQPGEYGQQPGQYGQPTGQYGQQPGQYGQYPQPYDQAAAKGSKRSMAVIGGVGGVIAVLLIAVVLVLGFWQPGFFVTTKLDVSKAQAGVQQILSDETNGYGAKNVKDVKCNKGSDPIVKKGGTFDCDVSIDGASKHVTVTFQDDKGTYEVGRPQ
jgi:hypothetical protein